jgi:hypothetical protein
MEEGKGKTIEIEVDSEEKANALKAFWLEFFGGDSSENIQDRNGE